MEVKDPGKNSTPDLVVIDFEYCAYNHRGFDLANHFAEWRYDYTNPEWPHFYRDIGEPTLEQKVGSVFKRAHALVNPYEKTFSYSRHKFL